ncbi:VOC family protein [Flavihumibacter fluvii]|uniref:VOC family protein n=1 Tax=Flavihumibacter fluvii TaxID=2838157 RepID=UPI001BDF003F|nr:VOC family protein [Flavihumibacter fluvii]ULQ54241.1 VOC family protein [Flavihumibacter fluvii]
MIKGLFETHVYVKDLVRAIEFYSELPGLQQCHSDELRKVAFFWVGSPKKFMLGIWEMPETELKPRHFAFECDREWILNESVNFLQSKNIRSYNFLKDGTERPMVFCWMPAIAIYFEDPDGNVLEFISMLDGEGNPALGVVAYDDWIKFKRENK